MVKEIYIKYTAMIAGILTTSISRQAGGLFVAMNALSKSLLRIGCNIQIYSGRDQFTQDDQAYWSEVPVEIMDLLGPSAFSYMPSLQDHLHRSNADLLHTHGLWMYPSVATLQWAKRQQKPYLITPHGMLDPWAVRNSYWKKWLAGQLYENAHLRGATCLHALCEAEYKAIRAYGLRNPVAIIPNGVDLPDPMLSVAGPEWQNRIPAGAKVMLYLGRLHPKKGLVNLLDAWAQARRLPVCGVEEWHLVIAGWDQGGHQEQLIKMVNDLRLDTHVHFIGPQFGNDKSASFRRATAFVLPSFSEGLPMTVLEAWSYGLPVLMTPQCNLPEGLIAGAAVYSNPETNSLVNGLSQLLSMDEAKLIGMGKNGMDLVAKQFTWDSVATRMFEVYQWVLGRGSLPDCIMQD